MSRPRTIIAALSVPLLVGLCGACEPGKLLGGPSSPNNNIDSGGSPSSDGSLIAPDARGLADTAAPTDGRQPTPAPLDSTSPPDRATPAPDSMPPSVVPAVIRPGTPRNLTAGVSANDQNPLWLDATTLAFTTQRAFGNFDVWVMAADGKNPRALTAMPGADAVNMPGGAYCKATGRIVFSTDKDGSSENIWTIKPDGTGLTRLTDTPYLDWEPSWSGNCDRIVFQSQRGANWDIYTIKPDGSDLKRLTTHSANDWNPSWSPTANTIVFQSNRTGVYKLWTVDANGGAPRQLTVGGAEDTDCSWSPDGSHVVFSTDRGATAGARIGILDMTKANAPIQLVTSGNDYDGAPCWSTDGKRIAFESDRAGNLDIWVVDLQ